MDLRLTGKTAVVTGASKGIGLAIARALTEEGVRVVAAARTITSELRDVGVTAVSADLATAEGPRLLIAEALEVIGGIDVLVNNVGGGDGPVNTQGFLTIDDGAWQRAYDLNFFSAVRVTRAALPSLIERRGVIVNISSIGARSAYRPIDYGTAKAALNNLSKALAEEFGPQGVRVVTVSPGPTRTQNWEDPNGLGGELARAAGTDLATFLDGLPKTMGITTGRMAEPDEIAALVAFLASPCAGNITGSDYLVDGGVVKTV